MREKVTIVMATYNGEDFLEKQLNSIINQTVKPDEIVIIDDASKDNTKDIILDFEKKNREISFQNIFRDVN
ncbi:glycosyltransferase, partial [Ligilactobacillus salivarius]|uniref:glycosyltransferase n=1 Tax=Ligilactobacillus salivarius TaxID=1624 RepID=UPI00192CE830